MLLCVLIGKQQGIIRRCVTDCFTEITGLFLLAGGMGFEFSNVYPPHPGHKRLLSLAFQSCLVLSCFLVYLLPSDFVWQIVWQKKIADTVGIVNMHTLLACNWPTIQVR